MQREIAFGIRLAMTVDTVVGKKRFGKAAKVFVDLLARRVSLAIGCGQKAEQEEYQGEQSCILKSPARLVIVRCEFR